MNLVRASTAFLLVAGLAVPTVDAVLCREADGRVEVEPAIGGLCADHLVTAEDDLQGLIDGCASCIDVVLPESSSTLSNKTRDAEPPAPLPVLSARASVTERAGPESECLTRTPVPAPQLAQIASVVLLR